MTDKYKRGNRKEDDMDEPGRHWGEKLDDLLELNERILNNLRDIVDNTASIKRSNETIERYLWDIKWKLGA